MVQRPSISEVLDGIAVIPRKEGMRVPLRARSLLQKEVRRAGEEVFQLVLGQGRCRAPAQILLGLKLVGRGGLVGLVDGSGRGRDNCAFPPADEGSTAARGERCILILGSNVLDEGLLGRKGGGNH